MTWLYSTCIIITCQGHFTKRLNPTRKTSLWACSSVGSPHGPFICPAFLRRISCDRQAVHIFKNFITWACSSAGRAFGSHPRGREFESLQVHQKQTCKRKSVFYAVTWIATSSFSVPPHCVSNVLKSSNDTLNSISSV